MNIAELTYCPLCSNQLSTYMKGRGCFHSHHFFICPFEKRLAIIHCLELDDDLDYYYDKFELIIVPRSYIEKPLIINDVRLKADDLVPEKLNKLFKLYKFYD